MKSIKDEWDEVRGLSAKGKVVEREEWMLTLPEGRRQDAMQYFRGGKTSFSKSGAAEGVDSSWTSGGSTNTTRKKGERDYESEALEEVERRKRAKIKEAMDDYNSKNRPKSLTELHLEGAHLKDKKKKRKKKKKKESKKDKEKKAKKKKKKRKRNQGVTDSRVSMLSVGGFSRDAGGGAFGISQESKAKAFKDASELSTRFSSGSK